MSRLSGAGINLLATVLLGRLKSVIRGLSHDRPSMYIVSSCSVLAASIVLGGRYGVGYVTLILLRLMLLMLPFTVVAAALMCVWNISNPASDGSFSFLLSSNTGILAAISGCDSTTRRIAPCIPEI